ncbi:MAG: molybdopterin/thiamine biosynthesis adenylyltransferase/rhodanese-related sulfurtransferase [Oleiphilaceae bacterium]
MKSYSQWREDRPMNYDRYVRQLSQIGIEGQSKLNSASVLIVGCGGLGCPVLLYLAAAGVGSLTVVDNDTVDLSNIHRQILFNESEVGKPKVEVAKSRINALNSEINLQIVNSRFELENAENIINGCDLVIDCTDNFKTRELINRICCISETPFISSSVLMGSGQVSFFDIKAGCYKCLYPELPPKYLSPNCVEAGVLGTTVGVTGTLTANMAIEVILGNNERYLNKFFIFNSSSLSVKQLEFEKNHSCPSCVSKEFDRELEVTPDNEHIPDLEISLDNTQCLEKYRVIDVRAKWECQIKDIPNSINIPMKEIMLNPDLVKIDDKPILFVCQSGVRSYETAKKYYNTGVRNIYSLSGGASEYPRN